MHGQSKSDSFLLEFIGLCVAWTKSEPAIFFSFSVDFGCEDFLRRRTPLSLGSSCQPPLVETMQMVETMQSYRASRAMAFRRHM
jgi:hypothetical protein